MRNAAAVPDGSSTVCSVCFVRNPETTPEPPSASWTTPDPTVPDISSTVCFVHKPPEPPSTAMTTPDPETEHINFWMNRTEMDNYFCRNREKSDRKVVTQYFNYLNFIHVQNVVMTVWCLLGWIPHANNMYQRLNSEGFPTEGLGRTDVADLLFLSSFQPSTDPYWKAMMILGTITMCLSAPVYFFVSERYLKDFQVQTERNPLNSVKSQTHPGRALVLLRNYIIFAIMVCIPPALNYALLFSLNQKALKAAYQQIAGEYPSTAASPSPGIDILSPSEISIVVVVVKTVSDLLFEYIADLLIQSERKSDKSFVTYRYHRLFMLVVFRIINTMSLFIIRYYADVPFYPCQSGRMAYQAFVMIMLELTLNNMIELGGVILSKLGCMSAETNGMNSPSQEASNDAGNGPLSNNRTQNDIQIELDMDILFGARTDLTSIPGASGANHAKTKIEPNDADTKATLNEGISVEHTSKQADDDNLNTIELTDDYFELFYRQYLMLAFMGIFPLICAFTLLCSLLEWPIDKYRFVSLYKGCVVKGDFKNFRWLLIFLLLFSSVAGLLHFPSGPAWFAPPVGPVLCWPCNTFAQANTAGGTCLPGFEPSDCRDAGGAPIGQDVIQGRIRTLVNASSSSAAAADTRAWFETNDHLFSSPRCGCRPCNLAISSACDRPPIQRFSPTGSAAAATLPPLWTYSYRRWQQRVAAAVAGGRDGANISRASGCGDPVSQECWTAPEGFDEFVDPIDALLNWRRIYFCQRCTASPCVCDAQAGGCAWRYEDVWQMAQQPPPLPPPSP